MNLNEMAKEIHQNAVDHGFYEKPPVFGETIALCHSELSEALEEYRNGKPNVYYNCSLCEIYDDDDIICLKCINEECAIKPHIIEGKCEHAYDKPEGVSVELADCIIRILDYADFKGLDMNQYPMDYNSVLDWETFGDFITLCHACLTYAYMDEKNAKWIIPQLLHDCIIYIFKWSAENNVDMVETIRIKHEYNKTRPFKHGGKIL